MYGGALHGGQGEVPPDANLTPTIAARRLARVKAKKHLGKFFRLTHQRIGA
jgi:hypothetical protein